MLTRHNDQLEIFLCGGDLQIWTKVGDYKSRIERSRTGDIGIFDDTEIDFCRSEGCLTEIEIVEVLEVIHNDLLSQRS